MTKQDQIKAIAELDGWKPETWEEMQMHWPGGMLPVKCKSEPPPYLTSRDAIVPVVEKLWQKADTKSGIDWQLRFYQSIAVTHLSTILFATPPQLCEALLRATGKWEE